MHDFWQAVRSHFTSREQWRNYRIHLDEVPVGLEPAIRVAITHQNYEIKEHRHFVWKVPMHLSFRERFDKLIEKISAAIMSMEPGVAFAEARLMQGRLVRLYGYEVTAVALDAVMTMAQYRPLVDDMEN